MKCRGVLNGGRLWSGRLFWGPCGSGVARIWAVDATRIGFCCGRQCRGCRDRDVCVFDYGGFVSAAGGSGYRFYHGHDHLGALCQNQRRTYDRLGGFDWLDGAVFHPVRFDCLICGFAGSRPCLLAFVSSPDRGVRGTTLFMRMYSLADRCIKSILTSLIKVIALIDIRVNLIVIVLCNKFKTGCVVALYSNLI